MANDFASLQKLRNHHASKTPEAYDDIQTRIYLARESIKDELLNGTLDKHGCARDAEKRAVLFHLTRILQYPIEIERQFQELDKKRKDMEAKATQKSSIHHGDILTSSWHE